MSLGWIRTEFKFKYPSNIGEDVAQKLVGFRRELADYIHEHIDYHLSKIRQTAITATYSYINKGTGKLGQAFIETKDRINQYTGSYGLFLSYIRVPYLARIIGDSPITIKPRSGHTYLTIPSGAESYGKRIRDFGITTVQFIPEKVFGTAMWYKAPNNERLSTYIKGSGVKGGKKLYKRNPNARVLFIGKKELEVTPKVKTDVIRNIVENGVQYAIPRMVANFMASKGM